MTMESTKEFINELITRDSVFETIVVQAGYDGEDAGSFVWTLPDVVNGFFEAINRHSDLLPGEEYSATGYKNVRKVLCIGVRGQAESSGSSWFGLTSPGNSGGVMLINCSAVALADQDNYQKILKDANRVCPSSINENEINFFVSGTEIHELGHLLTVNTYHHSASGCCGLKYIQESGGQFVHNNFCNVGASSHWERIRSMVKWDCPTLENH